ncbi:MAG TPA: hypothetical protein VGI88_05920, partial [Verrucomicrobiae bacterium]
RQLASGECKLRFIPDREGPTEADLNRVASKLKSLLGASRQIATEVVDVLLPTHSGKFRLTAHLQSR